MVAAAGAVGGHLWRGMSRADVKELGEIIDQGQTALVIIGESKLEQALDKAGLKSDKHIAKKLDVSDKDIDKAVQEAHASQLTWRSHPWATSITRRSNPQEPGEHIETCRSASHAHMAAGFGRHPGPLRAGRRMQH